MTFISVMKARGFHDFVNINGGSPLLLRCRAHQIEAGAEARMQSRTLERPAFMGTMRLHNGHALGVEVEMACSPALVTTAWVFRQG